MAKMFIAQTDNANIRDLSQYNYRVVEMPIVEYTGLYKNFEWDGQWASDLFNSDVKEYAFISLKEGQSITNMTDYWVIWFGGGTCVAESWFSNSEQVKQHGTIATAPWTFHYQPEYQAYGFIGWNDRDGEWMGGRLSYNDQYIATLYDFVEAIAVEPPVITKNLPEAGEITYSSGGIVTPLSVTAEVTDGGTLTYQWYKDGVAISGATEPSYIPLVDTTGSSAYYCEITNSNNGKAATVTSNSITIIVTDISEQTEDFDLIEWLTGWLYGMVGRLMFVKNEIDTPIIPDTPIVPEASRYLYGTPSSTGNIGLRVGDTVTYYYGGVLPQIPESDLPYAMIRYCYTDYGSVWAYFSSTQYRHTKNIVGETIRNDSDDNGEVYLLKDGKWTTWEEFSSKSIGLTVNGEIYNEIRWANHGILRTDGTVYVAEGESIPVTGIVGYSYNGAVLPELPEWDTTAYPYAAMNIITYEWESPPRTVGVLYLLDNAEQDYYEPYGGGANRWGISLPNGYLRAEAESGGAGWSDFEADSNASNALMVKQFKWANFDLLNEDGSTYIAKSTPIPIYE